MDGGTICIVRSVYDLSTIILTRYSSLDIDSIGGYDDDDWYRPLPKHQLGITQRHSASSRISEYGDWPLRWHCIFTVCFLNRFLFTLFMNGNIYRILYISFSGGYSWTDLKNKRKKKPWQMVTFDTATSEFTDYGVSYLGTKMQNFDGEAGGGIFYSQINETTLFTISYKGDHIHVYNLETVSFDNLDTDIPVNVGSGACLASSTWGGPRLYIAGGNVGKAPINNLQILDLGTMEWVNDAPPMIYKYVFVCHCDMMVGYIS